MQQAPTSFLNLVTKALRANFDDVTNQPLPQRWVDLIHHLNERERIDAERQSDTPKRPPSH
jgi:hypothetical protein